MCDNELKNISQVESEGGDRVTNTDHKDEVIRYLLKQRFLDGESLDIYQKNIMAKDKIIREQQTRLRKASMSITKMKNEHPDKPTPVNIEIYGVGLKSEDVIAEFTRQLTLAANRPIDTITNNINIIQVLHVTREETETLLALQDDCDTESS
jgi:hypothetical protein